MKWLKYNLVDQEKSFLIGLIEYNRQCALQRKIIDKSTKIPSGHE